MSAKRTLVVCPGRGTYTADDLGYLVRRLGGAAAGPVRPIVEAADAFRRAAGSKTITELDVAPRYSAALHLAGENAGPLIFTCSAVDLAILPPERYRIVGVAGNSMGWYTALHAGGVFGFRDALTVVDTMSKSQGAKPLGGQLILPWVDEDWRPDADRRAEIEACVAAVNAKGAFAAVSIELGGYLVLAGDDAGVQELKRTLPKTKAGAREYPFQLAWHAAFHTSLMADASRLGLERLSALPWRAPATTMIDGRGALWRPLTTRPDALTRYTFEHQVLVTYDFTRSLRTALRELAPEVIVLLGPGETLGGAIGQTLCLEGWQGLRSKSDFAARQKSDDPILVSMGRAEQFERFVAR